MSSVNANYFREWESSEWVPDRYDKHHLRPWNTFYIVLSVIVIVLNLPVVFARVYHPALRRELMSRSLYLLNFVLSMNHLSLGLSQLPIRVIVQLEDQWSEWNCWAHAVMNHFNATILLFTLAAISVVQYFIFVRLQQVKMSYIFPLTVALFIMTFFWVLLQFLPPHRGVYGRGGDYCHSSSWNYPITIGNLVAGIISVGGLMVAYARIFWHMYKTFKEGMVKKTMRQKVRESLFMQRFAMRGVLAVLNSGSFLVPMWISCYSILTTGQRPMIGLDAFTTTATFFGSVFDPIIVIAQDKKLRRVIFSWDWGAPLASPAGSWGNVSAAVFSTRSAGAATMGHGMGMGTGGKVGPGTDLGHGGPPVASQAVHHLQLHAGLS